MNYSHLDNLHRLSLSISSSLYLPPLSPFSPLSLLSLLSLSLSLSPPLSIELDLNFHRSFSLFPLSL